ncbi:MAG: protoglobin domain-containing protein [Pirellulaceae bacterium]
MNPLAQYELMPPLAELLRRYHELRDYAQLGDDQVQLAVSTWPLIEPLVPELIEDFYAEIMRHPTPASVLEDGSQQVERLKGSLAKWLSELFAGHYDEEYVRNRWIVGWRHVHIGLPQVWTAAALNRLKHQLLDRLAVSSSIEEKRPYGEIACAISRMLDLDLALIQDAYHTEAVAGYVETEKRLNDAIVDTTQAIVIVVDGSDNGRILRNNRYLARLVGDAEDAVRDNRSILNLIPAVDHPQIEELFRSQCPQGPSGPVVTRLIDAQQHEHTVRWYCRSIPYTLGQGCGRLCQLLVGHNISDLIEAQRVAVRQERLAAIGQTMAGLAHESRNAFQRSQASLETLALELTENPEALLLVERIQRANDHLLHLYQEVLMFAKPARLDLRRCQIQDVAKTTCQHIVQAGVCGAERIHVTAEDSLPTVLVDPQSIEQVLRNLIENALAASGDAQPIEVWISSLPSSDKMAIRVEIRDHGPGIPPEHLTQIFEPFFTTKSRGSGLGLPIARRLVETHCGRLDVESGPEGTRAVILLPLEPNRPIARDSDFQPDHRRQPE